MKTIFHFFALTVFSVSANAQTFDDPSMDISENKIFYQTKTVEKKETQAPKFFIPNEGKEAPKKEVQKRGSAKIKQVLSAGQKKAKTPKVIFVNFDDFKISSIGTFKTTCSMRFTILTNLDENLNSIDLRLTWPEIKTTISFSDVIPNQSTYIDYTLMGEGCYTMDKQPNIEVNRCRVKGMSQDECANLVHWVSKS